MQITEPDTRVMHLVEEMAAGPLPSWEAPPALLVLNKVSVSFSYVHNCCVFLEAVYGIPSNP